MDWSLGIAIISFLISGSTFLFYDRKIKTLDKKIKEYELEKIQEETIEKKKALITADISPPQGKINCDFTIYNAGKATAENIRVEFPSDHDLNVQLLRKDALPCKILCPEGSYTFKVRFYGDDINRSQMEVKLIWDDEYQKDRESTQSLPVY